MMIISLSRGLFTEVDDIDADLADINWYAGRRKSSCSERYYAIGGFPKLLMHRVIFERMLGRSMISIETVDHIDHNGLNNRRNNLRLATVAQNSTNQKLQGRVKSSKYKGVYHDTFTNRWKAQIKVNGVNKNLGRFDSELEASAMYDAVASIVFGDFACLNNAKLPTADCKAKAAKLAEVLG